LYGVVPYRNPLTQPMQSVVVLLQWCVRAKVVQNKKEGTTAHETKKQKILHKTEREGREGIPRNNFV
jgi:hypothetical protein